MKTKIIAIVLGVVLTGGIALWLLFKGSDKHLQLIPKDAAIVISADWKSLAKKADFEKIKQLQFYKELEARMKESSDDSAREMSKLIENPLSSGINFLSQTYMYVANEDDGVVVSFVFDIRDEEDFEKTVRNIDSTAKIIKGETFQYTMLSDARLAWSGKGGMIAFENGLNRTEFEAYLTKVFNQPKANSIADNDHFHRMMKKAKDLSFFMNGQGYSKMIAAQTGGMVSMDDEMGFLGKVYSFASLEFREDDIAMLSFQESDDPVYNEWLNSKGSGISDQTLQMITPEKVFGFVTASIDIQKMYEMVKTMPLVQKNLSDVLQALQWTEDDLKNAFAGEFSLALADVRMTNPKPFTRDMAPWMSDEDIELYSHMYTPSPTPYPVFTAQFTTTLKDKWKVLFNTYGRQMGFESTPSGDWVDRGGSSGHPDVWCVETPLGFVFTNDSVFAGVCKTGGNPNSSSAVKPYISGDAISGYMNLDITTYPIQMQNELNDNDYGSLVFTYIKLFKEVKLNTSMREGLATLALQPAEGNSLYQLIAQADLVYQQAEMQRQRMQSIEMEDLPSIDGMDAMPQQEIEAMP